MSEYQLARQINELLAGRSFKCLGATSTSKTDRALGVGFVDVESGEVVSIIAISGALEAHVVPKDA